jgi:hypothetical protein
MLMKHLLVLWHSAHEKGINNLQNRQKGGISDRLDASIEDASAYLRGIRYSGEQFVA